MRSAGKTGIFRAALVSVGLAVAAGAPHSARADNLADALVGAYNTSGLLEQNRALLRARDEDVARAAAALRPIVNWTTQMSRTFSNGTTRFGTTNNYQYTTVFTGLTLDLLLYDGGASRLRKQAAQETVLSARQSLLQVEQQILQRAVAAYINALTTVENVRLRQNNLRVLQEELRAAQDRFDVGEVTRTDVSLAEARVANARSGLASAQGSLANARAEYVNVVGHDFGNLAGQPRLPKIPRSEKDAQSFAQRSHPRILALQHQVAAADLNVMRAQKAYGPTANLQLSTGITDYPGISSRADNTSAMVQLRQPLFQGGGLAAAHRQAIAQRDSTRANLYTVKNDIVQGVTQAYVRLATARASLTATQEQVRASQVAFDGIREEAKLGARTTLDVLTAEQDLLNALTQRNQAQGELSFSYYQILSSEGILTAERLGLPVQIYDPTLYYNAVKGAPARLSKRGKDLDRVLRALGKK